MAENREFPNWEQLYETNAVEGLPWYWPTLDPDIETALSRYGVKAGRALDAGAGPGTQAIALAERGFSVTATDVSSAALAYASRKAGELGVEVTFLRDDVLATRLTPAFDLIVDRGCFHVLTPEQRPIYVESMRKLLAPSGWLFAKVFSRKQPGEVGPYRFTPDDIRALFGAERFNVLEVTETIYHGQFHPAPYALFCAIRRIGEVTGSGQ